MDLIIRNAFLVGEKGLVDIGIKYGRFLEITPQLELKADKEIDAGGRLVSPPFIDPHVHLDAVLTAGKPRYNISGSHPEGIDVWGEYKKAYPNFEDFKSRARKVIEWEVAQGTLHIRTHIDVCDPNLTALKQMLELRDEVKDIVDVQIVAFPQDGILTFDTYPKRLGITRVKELLAAGINVSLGHDSIVDPWYPMGQGDMLSVAQMAIHVCHMSGFDEIHKMLDTITTHSAQTLGITKNYGLEEGKPADLVLLDAYSVFDVMRLSPARLFVIKSGIVIAETDPSKSQIHYSDQSQSIDFKLKSKL